MWLVKCGELAFLQHFLMPSILKLYIFFFKYNSPSNPTALKIIVSGVQKKLKHQNFRFRLFKFILGWGGGGGGGYI